ncbi:MAG: DUF1501 domain-containing protein, partial [Gemmatales bacterium]|nr:DUF1501 domain-containing protein [Gemmatales bacterium]
PFFVGADPAARDFTVGVLLPPLSTPAACLDAHRPLLAQLDQFERRNETRAAQEYDNPHEHVGRLLTSPRAKQAFDLSKEPARLRDRYGRNTFGQSCLLARRLIEAGVRCVTVNHFTTVFGISCWDMHADGGGLNSTYLDYERHLCPQFDWAFTALIDDLDQRGMLQDTVVAVLSEFGRTPHL